MDWGDPIGLVFTTITRTVMFVEKLLVVTRETASNSRRAVQSADAGLLVEDRNQSHNN